MSRLYLLLTSPLLLAFAPVPIIKPMTDPDQAIVQFDAELSTRTADSVPHRKRQLQLRLEEMHAALVKRGKPDDAEALRERLLLLRSLDADKPLGGLAPKDLFKRASADGKYQYLLHVIYAPMDRTTYNDYNDFGHWVGSSYMGQSDLKAGHWVYTHPRWFIWRDGPPRPEGQPKP